MNMDTNLSGKLKEDSENPHGDETEVANIDFNWKDAQKSCELVLETIKYFKEGERQWR